MVKPATTKWHKWFAWKPVKAGSFWVWLSLVERRWNPDTNYVILTSWDPGDYLGSWEYRELK